MQHTNKTKIEIENKTILQIVLIIAAVGASVWLAWALKTIILALFISSIIALGLDPVVRFLMKQKLPKGIAVLLTYLGTLILVIAIGTLAFTPMVNQTIGLLNTFPGYLENLSQNESLPFLKNFDQQITDQLSSIGQQAIQTTVNAFSTALLTLTVLVFTAYLLLDFENVKKHMISLFPSKQHKKLEKTLEETEVKLGSWLRGQLALMLIIGVLTYIGLSLLGVKYALSLALIAGLLEMVPIIGPILSVLPALVVAFGHSPVQAIGVLGLYILVQQLENNLIVPKVMQKAVGFNPLITMIAILVGGELLGVLGALIAVPATLFGTIVYKNFFNK